MDPMGMGNINHDKPGRFFGSAWITKRLWWCVGHLHCRGKIHGFFGTIGSPKLKHLEQPSLHFLSCLMCFCLFLFLHAKYANLYNWVFVFHHASWIYHIYIYISWVITTLRWDLPWHSPCIRHGLHWCTTIPSNNASRHEEADQPTQRGTRKKTWEKRRHKIDPAWSTVPKNDGKIHPANFMGKFTISTGPFSIAMEQITRGYHKNSGFRGSCHHPNRSLRCQSTAHHSVAS